MIIHTWSDIGVEGHTTASFFNRLSECTAVKWICTQILTIKGIITQNLTKLYNIINKYAELYRAPQRHACHFPRLSTWKQAQEQSPPGRWGVEGAKWTTLTCQCETAPNWDQKGQPEHQSERGARAWIRKRSLSMDQKEEPEHGSERGARAWRARAWRARAWRARAWIRKGSHSMDQKGQPEHGSERGARAWIRKGSQSMDQEGQPEHGEPEHGSGRAARAWIWKGSQIMIRKGSQIMIRKSMDQEGQPEHGSPGSGRAARASIRKGSQSMDQEGQPEHASEMQQTFIHELQWVKLTSMSYCGSNWHPWAIVGQTDIHELLWVKKTVIHEQPHSVVGQVSSKLSPMSYFWSDFFFSLSFNIFQNVNLTFPILF